MHQVCGRWMQHTQCSGSTTSATHGEAVVEGRQRVGEGVMHTDAVNAASWGRGALHTCAGLHPGHLRVSTTTIYHHSTPVAHPNPARCLGRCARSPTTTITTIHPLNAGGVCRHCTPAGLPLRLRPAPLQPPPSCQPLGSVAWMQNSCRHSATETVTASRRRQVRCAGLVKGASGSSSFVHTLCVVSLWLQAGCLVCSGQPAGMSQSEPSSPARAFFD